MQRRKGRRPAQFVDHIEADDSPEFDALLKRITELGLGRPGSAVRIISLEIPEYFAAMVDDLASRQGIGIEKFMGAILNEGLYEAYLELCAQVNEAKRAKQRQA